MAEMTANRKFRILIVDDEPVILAVLEDKLKRDFDVDVTASGKVALAKIPDFKPDLILLDAIMPDMNGWQVCRQIKGNQLTSSIKVVMISCYATADRNRLAGFQSGADAYIEKSCLEVDLLKNILAN